MDSFDHGWRIEQMVFSEGECDVLLRKVEKSTRTGRAGTRHLMSNPAVNEIAYDARLLRIARPTLDGSAVPFRATLFAKSGDKN